MARSRYRIFDDEYPYFMTCTVVAWLPVFAQPEFAEIVFDSWRFLKHQRQIELLGFVLMENHLHWIAVGPLLSERVGQFKSHTARQILNALQRRGYLTLLSQLKYFKRPGKSDQEYQLWQEGSHPQRLENEAMLRQKIQYIHDNPLRRGYVDDPVAWRYSSARVYAGHIGMMEINTDW